MSFWSFAASGGEAHAGTLESPASSIEERAASCEHPTLDLTQVKFCCGTTERHERDLQLCFVQGHVQRGRTPGPAPLPLLKLYQDEAITRGAAPALTGHKLQRGAEYRSTPAMALSRWAGTGSTAPNTGAPRSVSWTSAPPCQQGSVVGARTAAPWTSAVRRGHVVCAASSAQLLLRRT